MSNVNVVDTKLYSSSKISFSGHALTAFPNFIYANFKSSYLKTCSDAYVQRMYGKLDDYYKKIEDGELKINDWLKDYNENLMQLELGLLNLNGNSIPISSLRSFVNAKLTNLPSKRYRVSAIASTSLSEIKNNTFINNSVVYSGSNPFASLYKDYNTFNNRMESDPFKIDSNNLNNLSDVNNSSKYETSLNETFYSVKSYTNGVIKLASIKTNDSSSFDELLKTSEDVEIASSSSSICSFLDDYTKYFSEGMEVIGSGISSAWGEVCNFFEHYPEYFMAGIEPVGATVASAVTSLVEGFCQFIEALLDALVLFVTTPVKNGIKMADDMMGTHYSDAWESVFMDYVAEQNVTNFFNDMYENTDFGNWVTDNSLAFDTVRGIGNGVGYTAGVVAISVLTFGTATPAVLGATAGVAGVGKGTETAWANGANYDEGLLTGLANGAWEAVQWYIGSKIGMKADPVNGIPSGWAERVVGFFAKDTSSILSKILTSFVAIGMDSLDGAAEGFVQPFIQTLYADGYYDENGNYVQFDKSDDVFKRWTELFDDAGGFENVTMNAVVGAIGSFIGEVFDLGKIFKNKNTDVKVDVDISSKPEVSFNEVNLNKEITLADLKYESNGILIYMKDYLESNCRKFIYKNTNLFDGLNDEILNNGLYHFTDSADEILSSGYIRSSGMNASYGNRKTFFFNGIPDIGAFATNLDSIPLKSTAIKIQPDLDVVNSSSLKIRSLDDKAISWDGNFDLSNQIVTKEYFILVKENNELVYKQVSKEIFDNYENTLDGQLLSKFLSDKNNIIAIKSDYYHNMLLSETNANIEILYKEIEFSDLKGPSIIDYNKLVTDRNNFDRFK